MPTVDWANNVPMYICYAQVSSPDSQKWFARTLQALQTLNPAWHFQINSPGDNHYVDAGPLDCEITPAEGPYIGQCPLHLQVEKQSDGTAKVYLWINSLSSPYLLKHAGAPASKTVPPGVEGCDDFCQSLKKAFEARVNALRIFVRSNRMAGRQPQPCGSERRRSALSTKPLSPIPTRLERSSCAIGEKLPALLRRKDSAI